MISALENKFTLGAEYYDRRYVNAVRTVRERKAEALGDIARQITDGDHGVMNYYDDGVTYLLSECIQQGFIDTSKARYITPQRHAYLKKSALHAGDVLMIKTGDIGKSAVVPDELTGANISVHVAKITLKRGYNPYFVSAFLNGRYGYAQIERRSIKTTRPEVKLIELQDILIPKLSDEFDAHIEELTRRGIDARAEAVRLYTQAQHTLQDAIGFRPTERENITAKSFSEVFGAGRLDAEYFMPEYDALFAQLRTLHTRPLGEIVSITKSIEPGSKCYCDDGVPFIRVSDVDVTGITPPSVMIPADIVPDIERLYPKKDTILYSKDGTIGTAYKVEEDMKAVTSGALLHLRVKCDDVLPDYLALVLNSEAVRLQAERDANGAIIQHWRLEDIARAVIPILPPDIQHDIASRIQQSFTLRRNAETLIAQAVKSVEDAIEDNKKSPSR